jgi:hypothetical protein
MRNYLTIVLFFVVAVSFFAFSSCAGLPSAKNGHSSSPPKKGITPKKGAKLPQESAALASKPASPPPEFPRHDGHPLPPEHIMGEGLIPEEKLAAFLLQINAGLDEDFVRLLSGYYVEEAAVEGVNHDTAFAQMCLETGFLRYGGLVTPDMNNFCGLGAIGPEEAGLFFPDPRTGVRAHIQHLHAYASTELLNQELVDPRYRYVKRGSSPTINGLSGTWAADRSYDVKISRILKNLYEFSFYITR